MPKYEVFIKPAYRFAEITAASAEQARSIFVQQLTDNIEADHCEATNLETDDGEDPK